MLSRAKSDVIIHANEHGSSGLGTLASLLSTQPKQLVCSAVTGESSCQVRAARSSAGSVYGSGLASSEPRTSS